MVMTRASDERNSREGPGFIDESIKGVAAPLVQKVPTFLRRPAHINLEREIRADVGDPCPGVGSGEPFLLETTSLRCAAHPDGVEPQI